MSALVKKTDAKTASYYKIMSLIHLLLIEDDPPTRHYLAALLHQPPDTMLIGSAGSVEEGKNLILQIPADVLITDLRLPDGHGTELIRLARQAQPTLEILVISVLGDERSVVTAIQAGAGGYLLKDASAEEMLQAVKDIRAGHSPISASIARYLIKQLQPALPNPLVALTAREMDILYGVAKGLSYKDLAKSLGISHHTVPSHIKSIYRKLEVNSKTEAVFVAVRDGLIRL